jgi:cyclophilin family peptidyl-prolyl cis-trans isomerase/HEAT repeat protein
MVADRAASTQRRPLIRRRASMLILALVSFVSFVSFVSAQTPVTRIAVLKAEDRRARSAGDLALIRAGTRSGDDLTVRVAVRALGRLERPSLIPDILPFLKSSLPEIRAEAATALGQSLVGARGDAAGGTAANGVIDALAARLNVEAEVSVRSAMFETLGRAAATAAQVDRVEMLLVDATAHETTIDGRLGIASGFEALVRRHRRERRPSPAAIDAMRSMVGPASAAINGRPPDPFRDVRVRRLAVEALVGAEALDEPTLGRAVQDPDPQVRALAMRAAAAPGPASSRALSAGFSDVSPMVRIEALRSARTVGSGVLCPAAVSGASDRDAQVVLVAIDQLAACADSPDALALLDHLLADAPDAASPRGWHRAAHALVALAGAAPERSASVLGRFAAAQPWQLRMYTARAAAIVKDATLLEKLAGDEEDNVREAAVEALTKLAGHAADPVYIRQLGRSGYQVLRAAAAALDGTPNPDAAAPALKAAHERLVAEGRDNSHDARAAIEKTLAALHGSGTDGESVRAAGHSLAGSKAAAVAPAVRQSAAPTAPTLRRGVESAGSDRDLNGDDLRRLAAARARVTMRANGTFELMLFTSEAPATVLRFAHLAEAGYYNGLSFHRVVPNFVVQGGSPGANEYIGDAAFMRDEVGQWPHVRGAVGISTRGRDTGDAQIFIDLVDNPRLNHEYTVFAQVLNGMDVVDRILEGDIIETIEIVP